MTTAFQRIYKVLKDKQHPRRRHVISWLPFMGACAAFAAWHAVRLALVLYAGAGIACYTQGMYAAAIPKLRVLIRLHEMQDQTGAESMLAYCYMQTGRPLAAMREYKLAVHSRNADDEDFENYGDFLLGSGNVPAARAEWQQAVSRATEQLVGAYPAAVPRHREVIVYCQAQLADHPGASRADA